MITEYERLKLAPLGDLATAALDTSADITGRLSAFEALAARLGEIPGIWAGLSEAERSAIRSACALDLAAAGFIPETA